MQKDPKPINTLLIAYNRPEKTKESLEAIEAYTDNLFLFCDGNRNENDKENVRKVQKLFLECAQIRENSGKKTYLLLPPHNLGTRKGPEKAIQWFFEQIEYGHIIEDDIVVHPYFFKIHGECLEYFESTHYTCIGAGYELPKAPSKLLETRITRLVAWSTWKNKLPTFTANPNPWKTHGLKLVKDFGLKTQIFFIKEFLRLQKNPNWSWAYPFLQNQLAGNHKGLTPTTVLHKNIGNDGSGHNTHIFGETETWDKTEIGNYKLKDSFVEQNKNTEKTIEWNRYGKIKQLILRILHRIVPKQKRNP
jgi:hypothetical protein